MSNDYYHWYSAGDPQGYQELLASLQYIRDQLSLAGYLQEGQAIQCVISMYGGGSPTEFLGEARSVLQQIIKSKLNIPNKLKLYIINLINRIKEGLSKGNRGL